MLFENEIYVRLFQLNAGIYVRTRRWTERRLKALNMTYPQFGALMALSKRDNVKQSELAVMLETDTTTTMVLCDSLMKRGWLRRAPDKKDRRVNRLILTEVGKGIFAKALAQIRIGSERVMDNIPASEVAETVPLLERLYETVTGLLREESK